MSIETKRDYMREFMRRKRAEERRKRELHNARIQRYRDSHRKQIRAYTREQVSTWKKKLAVLKAAKAYVEGKSVAEQYEDFLRLNKSADELMREVGLTE